MQLTAGGNIGLSTSNIEILIKTNIPPSIELDITAYLLDQSQKVRGDHDMIFYGQKQTPNKSVVLEESINKSPYQARLQVNTTYVDPQINKIAICATLNEPNTISVVQPIQLEVYDSGRLVATAQIDTGRKTEKALILAEVYKYNNNWKFRFVDQGFNGGLKPLSENFGVEIAANNSNTSPKPPSQPTPPPRPPQPKVSLSKIKLDKNNSSISLTKKSNGFGKISVNLNWNRGQPKSQSFFQKLTASQSVDLDLGAMIQYQDGSIELVQALGNRFGDYNYEPYVFLEGDDRAGSSLNGENLHINGDKWDQIQRVLIFTFIYDGVARWAATDAVVTIRIPNQPEIQVNLTEGNNYKMCGIVGLQNVNGTLQANREVRYFASHKELDDFYDFGFRWVAGSKD